MRPIAPARAAGRWSLSPANGRDWPGDGIGVATLLAVTLVVSLPLLAGGTLIGQDSATQFYPWYTFLGEQLRQGEIPGWNPFQFAGAPFAADPQSGWTYLPAMLLFTLLPLPWAVPVFLIFHLALAGGGTYALARALGMPVVAAVVAGVSYELTGPVYGRAVCCPAAMEISAWTPTALLGVELALRAASPLARLRAWTIAGVALSQGLAAWTGQGAYYLILATAAYIAYRTLLSTPVALGSLPRRIAIAARDGVAIMAIGFGLAAAGMLPRLDYVARSSVAGGEYAGSSAWAAEIGGATPASVFDRLLFPNLHYPGAATLALALVALLIAGHRFAVPYFALLAAAGIVLASPRSTPLHEVLYAVLPRFEALHRHWPERVSLVVFIAPALLAGAAVATALDPRGDRRRRSLALLAPLVAIVALRGGGAGIPLAAALSVVAVALLLTTVVAAPRRLVGRAMPLLIVAIIAVDLVGAGRAVAAAAPYGGFHRVDVADYYRAGGAADFIAARTATEPARFLGYDPALQTIENGQVVLYRHQFADPTTRDLMVNNRAMLLGLDDVQGYNPVQVQRYVEYMTALNGHPQEYHDANVYPGGLASPLLDLLNVRFVVIPAALTDERPDIRWLIEHFTTVYRDPEVRVLENPEALPRAWIVHDAVRVAPGEALTLLTGGTVQPRTTAILETALPPLAPTADPAAEMVAFETRAPDRIRLSTRTDAPGLLMLSEIFDPGWRAYVDGRPAALLVADHVLRAIPIPAGVHTVELRYEVPTLLLGGAISLATVAALLTGAIYAGRLSVRRGQRRGVRRSGT